MRRGLLYILKYAPLEQLSRWMLSALRSRWAKQVLNHLTNQHFRIMPRCNLFPRELTDALLMHYVALSVCGTAATGVGAAAIGVLRPLRVWTQ